MSDLRTTAAIVAALALLAIALQGHVIKTENDILRWNDDWLTIGWAEDVVR